MHPLRKAIGCFLYATLAVFTVCYVLYSYYGENVIRKFLHENLDRSIKVDWDSIPLTEEELLKYRVGIEADDD
jgi:hypothetical protein